MVGQKDKILVIGDWFIDENWLMAKTNNYHSTDVGEAHYNSLIKGPSNFVLSVCGVASILKILSGDENNGDNTNKEDPKNQSINDKFDLVGVGAWNPRDTEIIQRILCAKNPHKKFMTPYTLTNNLNKLLEGCPGDQGTGCVECDRKNYQLINLVRKGQKSEENVSTNRIFRIYEGFGSDKPKLRYRFDWQIDLDENLINPNWFEGIDNVKAVIIVDHGKGVITDPLIDTLLQHYGDANWYVRNKLETPSWFNCLVRKNKKLKLLVVDQQLVNHTYGLRTWQRNGKLCRASLELLGELLGLKTYKHGGGKHLDTILAENAAVLFEKNWAIGGSRKKDEDNNDAQVYYFPKQSEKEWDIRVGRTSIFFNSLIFWDLMVGNLEELVDSQNTQLSMATTWAIRNMENWMYECTQAWVKEHDQALSGPFASVTGWYSTSQHIKMYENKEKKIQCEQYLKSWDKWNESSISKGIINVPSEQVQELHLWRSYGTLDKYVCPGGIKRSSINDLVCSLNLFSQERHPLSPFNALLIAEPGWGKSYLAQCLSTHFDFNFLSYSIAQMISTKELVDSFKEIASLQKRSKNKCLVFMDEIDAEIAGQTALGLLLSPMWDGVFKSEGYTNKIDPCIWIFACTKPEAVLMNLIKGRDFLSRINGPTINIDFLTDKKREDLPSTPNSKRNDELIDALCNQREDDDRRTEIVYQIVNFLDREYGPISEIESDVIDLFYNIFPVNGIRSIQIFVSKFRNIKKGIIRKNNVPKLINNLELEKQIQLIKRQEQIFPSTSMGSEEKIVKIQLDVKA